VLTLPADQADTITAIRTCQPVRDPVARNGSCWIVCFAIVRTANSQGFHVAVRYHSSPHQKDRVVNNDP